MDNKERRRFKRFDTYMSVKFKTPESKKFVEALSLSKDLSREGIKVNSDKDIKTGETLDLEITIPDDPKPIQTAGKVMWSHPSGNDEEGYDQGIRFVAMDPVDKFRILDYAYNHWLETKINDFNDPEDIPEAG